VPADHAGGPLHGWLRTASRPWLGRLGLVLLLSIAAAVCAGLAHRTASSTYEGEIARVTNEPDYKARMLDPQKRSHRADTFTRMVEQNALLFQWAIVLLGAVAALITTSKVHRIESVDLVYVLLAPAAILLLGSITIGIDFQRSLTFLVSKDLLHVTALNDYLLQQGDLLYWALVCLAAFVVVFYVCIVFGGVTPAEDVALAGRKAS
jgi:hypothetical protein